MPAQQMNMLIDHLDKSLQGTADKDLQQQIQSDLRLSEEFEYLETAVGAIRSAAIYEQVEAAKMAFKAGVLPKQQARVLRFNSPVVLKNFMRVAAVVVVLLGCAAIYKYSMVNADALYGEYYDTYQPSTKRGLQNAGLIESAFMAKDWLAVIDGTNKMQAATNKEIFLSGAAFMELKNYAAAILAFNRIIEKNHQTGDNYFEDEANYYLALACLANREEAKALSIFQKIKADPANTFNKRVEKMGNDLYILSLKKSK